MTLIHLTYKINIKTFFKKGEKMKEIERLKEKWEEERIALLEAFLQGKTTSEQGVEIANYLAEKYSLGRKEK